MSVRITNAVVQNGDVTITSAQFVVADGLSYGEKVTALSTLVEQAAVSLDLPHQGPLAAEILYRIADERAGAAVIRMPERPQTEIAPQAGQAKGLRWWISRMLFWAALAAVLGAAMYLQFQSASS